jgi:hypothetical protein
VSTLKPSIPANPTDRRGAAVQGARTVIRYVWNHPSNAGHRVRALLRLFRY